MHTDVTHQNSLGNQNLTNDSNSFPTPDTTQSVQPVKKMRGPRLNPRGIAVLEEYLRLHPDDTQPATMTQKSLLAQVQSAQGNSDLKLASIYYWFRRRRVKLEEQSRQPPPQSSNQGRLITTPLTPTSPTTPFTEETLIKLHTLAQATPNPGPEVLDIWASLFHVSRPVLQYAIEVVLPSHFRTTPQTSPNSRHTEPSPRSPTSPTYAPSPRSRRLPTPPRSSTPELLPRDRWSRGRTPNFSKNETHSPLIPNMNIMGGPPAFHQYDRPSIVVPSAPLLAPASLPPVVHEQPLLHLSPPQTPVAKDNSNTLVAGPGPPAVMLSSSDMTALRISAVKNSVMRGLTEACLGATVQNNNTQEPLPKTAAESNQRFAPYNATLENLSIFLDVMLKQPSPPPSHE